MNKTPWLAKRSLTVINLLLESYQLAFGECLITSTSHTKSNLEKAKSLFAMPNPVIAHDNSNDPCLNYANAAALELWDRDWHEMIGMPSRLTAPETEYKKREQILGKVQKSKAIKNYQGIRINSKGEYFMIKNVKIWTIWDEEDLIYGQAATFDNWCQI